MDTAAIELRIFELRRMIANLEQEYRVATDKDLQFSVKKKIRLQIKDTEQELALLQDKFPTTDTQKTTNLN
jgi:hypothetical protein